MVCLQPSCSFWQGQKIWEEKKKKKKSGNPFWFNFEKVIEMSRAFFFFLILVLIQADSSFKNVLEFGCYEVQWETFLSSAKLPLFNF